LHPLAAANPATRCGVPVEVNDKMLTRTAEGRQQILWPFRMVSTRCRRSKQIGRNPQAFHPASDVPPFFSFPVAG